MLQRRSSSLNRKMRPRCGMFFPTSTTTCWIAPQSAQVRVTLNHGGLCKREARHVRTAGSVRHAFKDGAQPLDLILQSVCFLGQLNKRLMEVDGGLLLILLI